MKGRKRIVVEVLGQKGEYWAETLYAWLREEAKDILEQEYGVEIDVVFREADVDEPMVRCCGYTITEVPGEPGYLIEQLKLILDRAVRSGASPRSSSDDEA